MKTINIAQEFAEDYSSRVAGEKLRKTIEEAIGACNPLTIDFSDIVIASTSFLDESIAKLGLKNITRKDFEKHISLLNLDPRDKKLLENLCKKRGF